MRTLYITALWALTFPLQGQTENKKDGRGNASKVPVRTHSEQNREAKEWQAIFGLGHVSPFIGIRARISLFLDRDNLVFIDAGKGQASTSNPFPGLSNTITDGRKFAAGYKQFLSNSFYFEGSVFQRSTQRKVQESPESFEFASEALGLEFLIGNQWHWNRFTLGCDWVGVHVPVSIYGERSKGSDGTVRFDEKSKDFKNFNQSVQPILAGFYLGFSF